MCRCMLSTKLYKSYTKNSPLSHRQFLPVKNTPKCFHASQYYAMIPLTSSATLLYTAREILYDKLCYYDG